MNMARVTGEQQNLTNLARTDLSFRFCTVEFWRIQVKTDRNLFAKEVISELSPIVVYTVPRCCRRFAVQTVLTLRMLGKKPTDDILKFFFSILENKIWHIMQIVPFGEPYFLGEIHHENTPI